MSGTVGVFTRAEAGQRLKRLKDSVAGALGVLDNDKTEGQALIQQISQNVDGHFEPGDLEQAQAIAAQLIQDIKDFADGL